MSDLEEENRDCSDWLKTAEWSEDQMGTFLDCAADMLCEAKRLYEAIQIPGELNTRVRAAIESDWKRKKRGSLRLAGVSAAAIIGACYMMSQIGNLSNQKTEFTDPSRNVTAYPETREDVTVLQTSYETVAETVMETESLSEKETQTGEFPSTSEVKIDPKNLLQMKLQEK